MTGVQTCALPIYDLALEADPDWVSYRKKSAETGNVQHQECKIIKSTKFSPM